MPRARGRTAPLLWLGLAGLGGCSGGGAGGGEALLADVTVALGLPAADPSWPDGTYFLPEITQAGAALLDADGDGLLDLFHVRIPPPGSGAAGIQNRFYRRRSVAEPFQDVTAASGMTGEAFGQMAAVGDVDNDGDLDLFVGNYGPDSLHWNDGAGRFTDVTARAGLAEDGWTAAAAFGDGDADGWLDLFVVHYQRFDDGKVCTDASARREYCGPIIGMPDQYFRNAGDGTFTDATQAAGIVLPQRGSRATGLGIVFTDLTRDGKPDVFVANDAQANQLWVNQGDGTFLDQGIQRGVAFNREGQTEANMGIAVGDVNGDLLLDLFVTHLWGENNRLYLGTERPVFRDFTVESGLARHDLERTGFGTGFFDLDHDGDQDVAVVNGGVKRRPPLSGARPGFWSEYAEPNQLFENQGDARFVPADAKAGPFAREVEVSRGLAFGDLDEDGDLDLVVTNVDNGLRVYRNDAPPPGTHWLKVRALTRGRDALGAQVTVRAGERSFLGLVLAAYSYGSSCDLRAHFGLGAAARVDGIVVLWPDGQRESFAGCDADQVVTLRQGEGRAP
ncbi:MAG TPA: CRTAC1 family protein [Planctomycetota bacterium]